MERIVIFGAGNIGYRAFNVLKNKYDIVAYSDNNSSLHGTFLHGKPIVSPSQIENLNPGMIIVAMARYGNVGIQLRNMGYKNIYILEFEDNGYEIECVTLKEFKEKRLYDGCDYNHVFFNMDYGKRKKAQTNNKRNVLMISFNFPPEGGPGVQRTLKYVKYLREFNYEPIVLTCGKDNKFINDSSLENEIPDGIRVIRVETDAMYSWEKITDKAQDLFDLFFSVIESKKIMEELVCVQDKNIGHPLPDEKIVWAAECIKCIEEELDFSSIDIIYSTAPSFSQHILGCYFKKKYNIPWVADYRDLWASDENYLQLYNQSTTRAEYCLFEKLESELCRYMDYVIVAGGYWKEGFIKKYHVPENRITDITNGYDEADFNNRKTKSERNKKFTLCYNGSMRYKNRNPVFLLNILNELVEEKRIDEKKVQWVINGQLSADYIEKVSSQDVRGIIKLNGVVSHSDSIDISMNSDLLVFYGEGGELGKINYPGKFYEYLRFGRRILCFSGRNSFQDVVLHDTGLGKNFDYDQKEDIKDYILNEYLVWEEGSMGGITVPFDKIEVFERKNLTQKMAEIFDSIEAELFFQEDG